MADYKRAKDVAVFVREILKEEFPDTKFSVRTKTYSMGASIDVEYWDGPIAKEVESKIGHLASVSHMDITDLVHYKNSTYKGEKFHSGAHHIFVHRRKSKAFLSTVAQKVADNYNGLYDLDTTVPPIQETEWGARLTDGHSKHYDVVPQWADGTPVASFGTHYSGGFTFPELVDRHASQIDARDMEYADEPDGWLWLDEDGELIVSTYFHGKVKSKTPDGNRTDSIDSDSWDSFKEKHEWAGLKDITEADEIDTEDLEAAAEVFDNVMDGTHEQKQEDAIAAMRGETDEPKR